MKLLYILTYDCNFRCKYCDIVKESKSITQDIIDASFEFLKKNNFNIDEVKFFGGEPLMKKNDIVYIIENIPIIGAQYYITSNASLANDSFIEIAKKHNIKLTFSIDGDFETTTSNRKEFGTKKLYDTILYNTSRYSPFIRVNMVITSSTAKKMVENFKFLYTAGVRKFNFLPEYWNNWTKEGLRDLISGFDTILKLYKQGMSFELINIENYQDSPFFNVGLIIDIDGKIYGTNHILAGHFAKYKTELEIGNVFDGLKFDIQDPVFSEKYREKLDYINHNNYEASIVKSVGYIDQILNNFVKDFKKVEYEQKAILS